MTNTKGFKYNQTGMMGVSVRGFSDPGCVLDNSSLYTQKSDAMGRARGPKTLEKETCSG